MSRVLAASPQRGSIVEEIGGRDRSLALRIGDLERLEEACPRGVYSLMFGLMGGPGESPITWREVRAVLVCALIGGGMGESVAEKIMAEQEPGEYLRLRVVANAALSVALMPAAADEDEDEPGKSFPDATSDQPTSG